MSTQIYPLLFTPVCKDLIWGGDRIARIFNREPKQKICAESWEISDRPEGMSTVSNGPLAGSSLHELVETMHEDLLGSCLSTAIRRGKSLVFPLLIKIIDAKQRLSVQVHPDERTADICGGEAKTEMWYVLDAEPEARIFAGLRPGVDRQAFEEALRRKQIEDTLCSIALQPGMAIYIPGGRIHSIGEGSLLLEAQQNSNTTYRVYDWDRPGKDDKLRDLHIEQALHVINWEDNLPLTIEPSKLEHPGMNSQWKVITCPYFHITRFELLEPETTCNDGSSFHILFTVTGNTDIEGNGFIEKLSPGTSCLLPAALDRYTLTPTDGNTTIIRISLV